MFLDQDIGPAWKKTSLDRDDRVSRVVAFLKALVKWLLTLTPQRVS